MILANAWLSFVGTLSGAIVGGGVVLFAGGKSRAAERAAVRNDHQRRWIVELQDALMQHGQVTSRVMIVDEMWTREGGEPDWEDKDYLALRQEWRTSEARCRVLLARIDDQALIDSAAAAMLGLRGTIYGQPSRGSAWESFKSYETASAEMDARVPIVLRSL